jgi:hypothetical protein
MEVFDFILFGTKRLQTAQGPNEVVLNGTMICCPFNCIGIVSSLTILGLIKII